MMVKLWIWLSWQEHSEVSIPFGYIKLKSKNGLIIQGTLATELFISKCYVIVKAYPLFIGSLETHKKGGEDSLRPFLLYGNADYIGHQVQMEYHQPLVSCHLFFPS